MQINSVYPFEVLREDKGNNFNIRKWIQTTEKGFLFLSCTPKERTTVIPLITAWLSIASDTLMQCPETDTRTWFFIDELHNLRKLPKLDLALAEIRKFGGCYVMGTQLIAQLEKIYGKELTRAITGLCGTKVVMNVPEPITAKYMADFLGEKEEITSTETLSYGANTMRDGANISQRYTKESVVSASQIMDLGTGEAFVRFYGIPIVGKVKFEYHKRNDVDNKLPKIALDERTIDVSKKTTKEIWAIIETLRSKYKHAVIIEKGNEITQQFARNTDIIIDPINGPYSWDIMDEFREDIMFFIDFILDKSNFSSSEKRELESYFFSKINENESQDKQQTNSLENVICNLHDLNSELKEDFIRQFGYLNVLINNYQKTSIARYIQGQGNILMFVPCLKNPDLIRISKMIKVLAEDNGIYVIEHNEICNLAK